jgi:excisionase family DNA binding protein
MAEPDELLTVAEIATELKMNQQTIRNWIDSGDLPAIRLDRRVRVKRSDFDPLLESSYTGRKQRPGGDVPVPVAPGERVKHEAAPPNAPDDAEEA